MRIRSGPSVGRTASECCFLATSGPRRLVQPSPPLDPYPLLRPGVYIVGIAVKSGAARLWSCGMLRGTALLLCNAGTPILPPGRDPGPEGGAAARQEWCCCCWILLSHWLMVVLGWRDGDPRL
jgi:hypothetical protein